MPYSETNMVKAVMKPSPSLIYNNLCMSAGNLVYAHTRQACTLQPTSVVVGSAVTVRRIESQHTDVIHTVCACVHSDSSYIVVTTEAGIQVWNKDATRLLYVWAFPAADAHPNSKQSEFARGVAINVAADASAQICFGTSWGDLHVLEVSTDEQFRPPATFSHHKAPITAVGSAYQSRAGKWREDLTSRLVTADEDGDIAVWEAEGAAAYKVSHSIAGSKVPFTTLAVRTDFIVAARLDGTVQILGLADGKLRSEIVCHSRWLSAMAIHPAKDVIATVSEDATIAVWELPIEGKKASNLLSACWLNAALTGVSFCGASSDDIAVVAYDTDEIRVFKA